jgi:predicted enzyme related to lactoylglutathione lyase
MEIRAIDFISYEVSDIKRAVTFYRDVLGLKVTTLLEEFGWAEFDVPPSTLALYSPIESLKRQPVVGGGMVWLSVHDVDAAIEELKGKGVAIDMGKIDTPVCHMAILKDPDGNQIGLHHRKDGTAG